MRSFSSTCRCVRSAVSLKSWMHTGADASAKRASASASAARAEVKSGAVELALGRPAVLEASFCCSKR
jgi:hypothetical protein